MPEPLRFVLHDHRRPSPHFDLRLEEDGVLRSWAVPKGLPDDGRHDRLAIAVDDHGLDHVDFEDEHKSVADADAKKLEEFRTKAYENLALDHSGALVYLAPTRVNLQLTLERWPGITFRETREHLAVAA